MTEEEMIGLIQQVWSDSMSDNGAIWAKSDAELKEAKALYPELYTVSLQALYDGVV
jgi:hypothetical protein